MSYLEENPSGITQADIVVAVPTFNEVTNITHVTSKIDEGLNEFYPSINSVIVNCDNHSMDGTKEAFFSVETKNPKVYLSTQPGERGKGNNLKNLFSWCLEIQPKVVVVIEADIRNVTSQWIYCFVEPVLRGNAYVVPLYVNHKYENTLEALVLYPLFRSLYGRRIKRPTAGDFAIGTKLLEQISGVEFWNEKVAADGIDLWIATVAASSRMPICQSFMGAPKIHRLKDPFAQINQAFFNIVSVFFDLMPVFQEFWTRVKWSRPTVLFNAEALDVETAVPVEVNTGRLYDLFIKGIERHRGLLESTLNPPEMHKLDEIKDMGFDSFSFPAHTWTIILYDIALAYKKAPPEMKEEILDALLPLYYGKVVSYVRKTERMSNQQAEEVIEKECMVFEENKRYLVSKWQ